MKQTSSIGIMDFIRPHKGGFLCSVVLSVLGVASGIVPYFAVAKMINLLIVGEQDFSIYLLWCSVALVAFIMKSVFHGFSTKASHEATFAVLSEIRRRIASKLTKVYGVSNRYAIGKTEKFYGRASRTDGGSIGAYHSRNDF